VWSLTSASSWCYHGSGGEEQRRRGGCQPRSTTSFRSPFSNVSSSFFSEFFVYVGWVADLGDQEPSPHRGSNKNFSPATRLPCRSACSTYVKFNQPNQTNSLPFLLQVKHKWFRDAISSLLLTVAKWWVFFCNQIWAIFLARNKIIFYVLSYRNPLS
jgi:hypothetical protein